MAKCRHRKGIILAAANYVEFRPDQEPFVAGQVEDCGIELIQVESVFIHYCPKCEEVKSIDSNDCCEEF